MFHSMNGYLDDWRLRLLNSAVWLSLRQQRELIFKGGLIIIFLIAGLIRLYHVDAPGILIDREYTSAIFARVYYFEHADSVTDWQKEVAQTAKDNQPILEPPITDYVVSLVYRVIGSEQLWIAHVVTSLFWLIGGVFFYKLAQMAVSTSAAVVATAFYLFAPMSIIVSRSFQPDSLMMMLFVMSLYGIFSYYRRPTLKRLLIVAGITGLAFLVRPLIIFAVIGAFVALAINRSRSWKFILDRDLIIFAILSLLPSTLYYGYGIVFAGFLRWKVDSSFRPDLYVHRIYWEGWLRLAVNGVGYLFLIGAVLGFPTVRKSQTRVMLIGLLLGYIIFGLVFTMHIHTHGYYHAQLIPIVAIPLGSLAALYFDYLKTLNRKWIVWLPVAVTMLLILYHDVQTVRAQVGFQVFESGELAEEVGEVTNHSTRAVFVSRYYGMPLQYYGQLAGAAWPKAIEHPTYRRPGEKALSIQERLDNLGFEPEYFVITDFDNYSMRHLDLKEYLETSCSVFAKGDGYLIYDGHCNA